MKINSIINIAKKDILLLSKDKGALFFTIGFPIIMAVFFGSVFSGNGGSSRGISLAIADLDQTESSREYIAELSNSDALRVSEFSEEIASERVRTGKTSAMIVVPKGFGAARESLFDNKTPTIKLGIDPGKKAAAGMLEGILMARAAEDMQSSFSDSKKMNNEVKKSLKLLSDGNNNEPELTSFLGSLEKWLDTEEEKQLQTELSGEDLQQTNGMQGFTPMVIEKQDIRKEQKGPKNGYAISFPQGMVWGIIGAISTFSLALVTELKQGTLARLGSSPISRMSILAGKATACFTTIITVSSTLIAIGIFAFDIHIYSWPVLATSIVSSAIGFSGLMMLLSVLSKTEKSASGLSWAILMMFSMTGGGMIPLMFMPEWMATVGQFSPVKWAIVSYEGALWRQFSLLEILPTAMMLTVMGLVTFTIGSYRFNKIDVS